MVLVDENLHAIGQGVRLHREFPSLRRRAGPQQAEASGKPACHSPTCARFMQPCPYRHTGYYISLLFVFVSRIGFGWGGLRGKDFANCTNCPTFRIFSVKGSRASF
jgi:hypothetical protein